jgi:hypothetical protein
VKTELFYVDGLEVELFHVDAQTDRHTGIVKLMVTFHNFANMPKNRTDEY